MATDWQEMTVGEIATKEKNGLVGGPFGSNLVQRDYRQLGVPVIRGQNMGERYVGGKLSMYPKKKRKSLKPIPQDQDI
jgi:type I restriction enzyme S subunit